MKTRAPSSANAWAQALPSPLLAPVINALQSFKPRFIGLLLVRRPPRGISRTGKSPNRHAPVVAVDQLRRFWLPERLIHARAHKRDWHGRAPSQSAAPLGALRFQHRAAVAPPRGHDPPIPATGRRKVHPALTASVVGPNPAPPPGSAADHPRAKPRA